MGRHFHVCLNCEPPLYSVSGSGGWGQSSPNCSFPLHLVVGYLPACTSPDFVSCPPLKKGMHQGGAVGALSRSHAMIHHEAKDIGTRNPLLPPGMLPGCRMMGVPCLSKVLQLLGRQLWPPSRFLCGIQQSHSPV